jgi:ADP-ribosylglycohydrolase
MKKIKILLIVLSICCISCQKKYEGNPELTKISAEQLRDKIRGGLLGQILGNLNGIPHEMDYINEPGNVLEYIPALPQGAETDDDTDFEWVYIKIMQDENTIFLSPDRLTELWKERINRGIWCSNRYSRHLMDLGIKPPMTSNFVLNPWAEFNISGQFICETFGLLAPAMPQTASRIGLNYTRITIDLEPAQTTQLFCTMIATAFITDDIIQILDAGLQSLDSKSEIKQIVLDVSGWYKKYPENWRETRGLIKEKYSRYGGTMRDRNGYELNTASTIAALLYGKGDFSETLRTAFNFGWDADNTAATAGTIVGVMRGYKWMMSRGWQIVDRYKNTKRDNMPEDETITSFADRIIDLAEKVITDNDGRRMIEGGKIYYYIKNERPANVEPLPDVDQKVSTMKKEFKPQIERIIANGGSDQEMARSAYIAICIDLAPELMKQYPENWQKAVTSLNTYWKIMQNIFYDDEIPGIVPIREKSLAAGLKRPDKQRPVW